MKYDHKYVLSFSFFVRVNMCLCVRMLQYVLIFLIEFINELLLKQHELTNIFIFYFITNPATAAMLTNSTQTNKIQIIQLSLKIIIFS